MANEMPALQSQFKFANLSDPDLRDEGSGVGVGVLAYKLSLGELLASLADFSATELLCQQVGTPTMRRW
jgi:hypothetical protein